MIDAAATTGSGLAGSAQLSDAPTFMVRFRSRSATVLHGVEGRSWPIRTRRSRFAGRAGEQWTMFLRDPAGNALEFKAF